MTGMSSARCLVNHIYNSIIALFTRLGVDINLMVRVCHDTVSHDGFLPGRPGRERRKMYEQIELLDYLDSLEEQGFDILDYIPTGHENAATRADLRNRTGLCGRVMWAAIHNARRKIPILNTRDGSGYFIPDMNTEYGRLLLKRYVQQENRRMKNIAWALKAARQTLTNCGIDWRDGA